ARPSPPPQVDGAADRVSNAKGSHAGPDTVELRYTAPQDAPDPPSTTTRMDVLNIRAVQGKGDVEASEGANTQDTAEETSAEMSAREAELLRQLKVMRLRTQAHRFMHLRDSIGTNEALVDELTASQGPSLPEIRALREKALSPETSPAASAQILDQALQLTIEVVMNMQTNSDVEPPKAAQEEARTPFADDAFEEDGSATTKRITLSEESQPRGQARTAS
ncbi:MAG: hypothetical protein AAFX99_36470, partial [Myxococcota bacterium]